MPQLSDSSEYVVAIGCSTFDISVTSSIPLRTNGPHPCERITHKAGGCPRNVAESLARLGCDVRLISAWGEDAQGEFLASASMDAGVDLSATRVCAGMATGFAVIVNDCDGENYCMVGDANIAFEVTPQWLESHRTLLDGAAVIVCDVLSQESLAWLFAHYGDRPIFVDSIGSHFAADLEPWLSHIHTLKPNRQEASLLSGLPFASREAAPDVAQWFHQAGIRQIVLSLGRHGFYFSDGETAGWMAAPAVKVVNVTGAGDALLAGFVYGWLQGMPLAATAHFARGCAAMALMTDLNVHPAMSVRTVEALRV